MFYVRGFIALYIIIFSHSVFAENALDIVNQYRQAVGLSSLRYSSVLSQSAKNHAAYLATLDKSKIKSFEDAHGERAGQSGFTGKSVADRVKKVGYPHQRVSENISIGNGDKADSIELLMSGIYHRFGFLGFSINELGYGIVDKIYVYNMGRHDISAMCQHPPDAALIKTATDCLGTLVKKSFWDKLCPTMTKADLFSPPFKQRCANKVLLDKAYMEGICRNPPQEAILQGNGKYYNTCGDKIKIKATWLDTLCEHPTPAAIYPGDGRYYEICDDKRKVHAFWLEDVCSSVSDADKYTDSGKYYESCSTADYKIRKEYIDELDKQQYQKNPSYVMWPSPNAQQVDVAFYNEIPDPLPDLSVSGYPFSLQFNEGKVKKVKILQAKLDYQEGNNWIPVKKLRELNARTDPHKKFSQFEFAWYPLDKLKSGTRYRVTVNAQIDGQRKKIQWQFKTKSLLGLVISG